ncbi:0168bda9-b36d-47f6-bc00-d5f0b50b335c [Thermothielavioides terrestris]|uniref:Defective in cullin neddylation protein n=1 Tax=Thermothielavioides terrestris TaxID=2587410 RepID=A0A446BUW5_9PEZI|nr:0168bda9-b36d-47f6-bc00-d5f0b50b335c [Thermothielavioides terrestris]
MPRIGGVTKGKQHKAAGSREEDRLLAQLNQMFDELQADGGGHGETANNSNSKPQSDADELGYDAIMSYLARLGIQPEHRGALVLLDIVRADSPFAISRAGFVGGWAQAMRSTATAELLPPTSQQPAHYSSDTPAMADTDTATAAGWAQQRALVRARVDRLIADPAYFAHVYELAFRLGRGDAPAHAHAALPMDVAVGFWEALYGHRTSSGGGSTGGGVDGGGGGGFDFFAAWRAFLWERFGVGGAEGDSNPEGNDNGGGQPRYKGVVTRDLWNQTRRFAAKTTEDGTLGFWSEDQAWPRLIDEFVVWCRDTGVVAAPEGRGKGRGSTRRRLTITDGAVVEKTCFPSGPSSMASRSLTHDFLQSLF